jgi:hypothetical protein
MMMGSGSVFSDNVWTGANGTVATNRTGQVSIGTTTVPGTNSKLQINGGAAIGYSAATNVPSNGLAVAGQLGVGLSNPYAVLDVYNPSYGSNLLMRVMGANNGFVGICDDPVPGSWNPLVQQGDKALIFSNGTQGTGGLVIGQWSTSPTGIRIDPSGAVEIGVGEVQPDILFQVMADNYNCDFGAAVSNDRVGRYGAYFFGGMYGIWGDATGNYGDGDANYHIAGCFTASGASAFQNCRNYGIYSNVPNSQDDAGYFDGNVYASSYQTPSDSSLKENIEDLRVLWKT